MVLLEKLWDDVAGGVHPDHGLGRLRKLSTRPISLEVVGDQGESSKFQKSLSMPLSPVTPTTPTAAATPTARKDNVWRSVFHPGSNIATKTMGAHQMFDKPSPNSPTVYDWLYSGETKSSHR